MEMRADPLPTRTADDSIYAQVFDAFRCNVADDIANRDGERVIDDSIHADDERRRRRWRVPRRDVQFRHARHGHGHARRDARFCGGGVATRRQSESHQLTLDRNKSVYAGFALKMFLR